MYGLRKPHLSPVLHLFDFWSLGVLPPVITVYKLAFIIIYCVGFAGPRTAQGLTRAALDAAQSAVNQRLSGGSGHQSRSGKVLWTSIHVPVWPIS